MEGLFQFLILSAVALAVAQGQSLTLELNPAIFISAPAGRTLPLSCTFTITSGVNVDTLTFRWNRQTSAGIVSVDASNNTSNTTVQSSRGPIYYVTTLYLCDLEFEDAGSYECSAMAALDDDRLQVATLGPAISVSIHLLRTAPFQLRLTGVDNCGLWNANDTFRTMKSQTLTNILTTEALPSVCPPSDQQRCSFSFADQSFSCVGNPDSNGVTFTATVELRLDDRNSTREASELVDLIDNWKNTGDRIVNLASQNLLVDPSCDINSSFLCMDVEVSGGLGVEVIPVAVGGIVATLTLVCITVIVLAVVVAVVKKHSSKMMMEERLEQRAREQGSGHTHSTVLDKNGAYSSSGNYMRNVAYKRQRLNTPDLDDPSVTYYSSNSFGDYSQNAAYDDVSDNEDNTTDTTFYSSHHSREQESGHKHTVLNKNGAYSSSGNYMQNVAYNQSRAHTPDPDDPSVTYYSTNSNSFGEYSRNVAHDNTPDNEDDTAAGTNYHTSHHNSSNYSQNIAYKHSSGDDEEDSTYYYANVAYGARSHGPYEANVAYNIHSEDWVEEDGETD